MQQQKIVAFAWHLSQAILHLHLSSFVQFTQALEAYHEALGDDDNDLASTKVWKGIISLLSELPDPSAEKLQMVILFYHKRYGSGWFVTFLSHHTKPDLFPFQLERAYGSVLHNAEESDQQVQALWAQYINFLVSVSSCRHQCLSPDTGIAFDPTSYSFER